MILKEATILFVDTSGNEVTRGERGEGGEERGREREREREREGEREREHTHSSTSSIKAGSITASPARTATIGKKIEGTRGERGGERGERENTKEKLSANFVYNDSEHRREEKRGGRDNAHVVPRGVVLKSLRPFQQGSAKEIFTFPSPFSSSPPLSSSHTRQYSERGTQQNNKCNKLPQQCNTRESTLSNPAV
jgi:hypothetical protein